MADHLAAFIRESNRIEGIPRVRAHELAAHETFLALPKVTIDAVAELVRQIGGGPLRHMAGMNVRVGNHRPIPGGEAVLIQFDDILHRANRGANPWQIHVEYETLHPFMDGNGRSGRALWAWQVVNQGHYPRTLAMGFLHPAYYAALSSSTFRHHSAEGEGGATTALRALASRPHAQGETP